MQLLVNIDHVATLRNARGEGYPRPVEAAKVCEHAGAHGIVFHLRGDRRHILDHDVVELKKVVKGTLDFEMAATDEMIIILLATKPNLCTLVPEGREELTTEGGLNMDTVFDDFKNRVFPQIKPSGIEISVFLDPIKKDIEKAKILGADAIELHTGNYANAASKDHQYQELARLREAAILIHKLGMKVNAGHGLNLQNLPTFLEVVPYLNEVSIGHALISDALFMGLSKSVKSYIEVMSIHEDID
jgi:pyridoxine 5-phosphate synthase